MKKIGLLALALCIGIVGDAVAAASPTIRLVDFQKIPVTGATAKRIIRAIDQAEEAQDDLVLIEMNTPGGLVTAMEEIVQRMLSSKVPVVVWVGPPGAHAASAGFFIMMAADLVAMAPTTRCGAASVIYGTPGQDNNEQDLALKKASQDLAALIRSMAKRRGRNAEAAEEAVFGAKAYDEAEALEIGIVELIARTREDLVEQLDGRELKRFDEETVVLKTADARYVETEFGRRQELFEFLANPTVAYLLFMIGLAGLWVELNHPGLVFPAVIGALCLILFFFAAQQLSPSVIGALLILLAIVMFVLEIKVASYGMLTLGGGLCLVIGSMMLFEGPIPELRVPPSVYLPSAIALTVLCAVALRFAVKAQRARVATGVEGLKGEVGTVKQALDPQGKVFVHGELWDAEAAAGPLAAGTRVRVLDASNMTLKVEPVEDRPEGGS